MKFTGRDDHRVKMVEAYAKEQGLWREEGEEPVFTDTLHLDLGDVVPSIAGPKRPQDRIPLTDAARAFKIVLSKEEGGDPTGAEGRLMNEAGQIAEYEMDELDPTQKHIQVEGTDYELSHGDVVIAAITSCTNTSNPSVMVAAGLVARKARALGMTRKPWVKTSLAPGSKVVTDYLKKANLQKYLDKLGFNLVGYGCTTCIGNSGPLEKEIEQNITKNNLTVCSVLSGNRNFEGRINSLVKANFLASPPLVVAFAMFGNININFYKEPIGINKYIKEIFKVQIQ